MNSAEYGTIRKPFIEHVRELQHRLTWSAIVIGICSAATYPFYPRLLELIQRPLGQTLYYTSPTGGFNFIFKICIVSGLVISLPFLLYQIFCFVGPLIKKASKRVILIYVVWSVILASAGVLFGYLISLPAALHFLTTIGGDNIKSLIRADEYFSFALAYIAGFALIFQVPLVMLFINRIKPIKPGKMMKFQRYIILFSFIISAVLTPTPDPINQGIMALPMVFLYQVGIVLVWLVNRGKVQAPNNAFRADIHQEGLMPSTYQVPKKSPTPLTVNLAPHPPKIATLNRQKRQNGRVISEFTTTSRRVNYNSDAVRRRPLPDNYFRTHALSNSRSKNHLLDTVLS